jgi:hypothetical protein
VRTLSLVVLALLVGCRPTGPAIGTDAKSVAEIEFCSSNDAMTQMLRAVNAKDTLAEFTLERTGQCGALASGTTVRVLDRVPLQVQDNLRVPVLQVRVMDGPRAGTTGYVLQDDVK